MWPRTQPQGPCRPRESHALLLRFQENHYQPLDQDACLPCDCFPDGSHSRACDMGTGQCACKPGVIGRQCNRCDNPFAQVTTLGCEGLRCPLTPFRLHRGHGLLGTCACVSGGGTLSSLRVWLCPCGLYEAGPSSELGSPPPVLTAGWEA